MLLFRARSILPVAVIPSNDHTGNDAHLLPP
jgi:hypothetical protein